jgi:TonB family protein
MGVAIDDWERDALPRGTMLHGYRIDAIIGRGGFGITYRASDAIDQVFAVKEYLPRQFAMRDGSDVVPTGTSVREGYQDCLGRFVKEARALLRLSGIGAAGEGVVKVATLFEANGTAYIVMEYLAGQPLEALIKAHPQGLPEAELRPLMLQLLRAVGCVHEAGILHRDIKPANILLREDGRPVLIDFGATRGISQGETATYTQIFSEGYAPIEQFAGAEQGPFSDIYALGSTLYRAVGGKTVDSFTRHQALLKGRPDPQPPAVEIGAGRYDHRLLLLIDRAMRVAPEERPQSVAELQALLDDEQSDVTQYQPAQRPIEPLPAAAAGADPATRAEDMTLRRQVPVTPPAALPRRSSRLPLLAGGLVAVAILVGAGWFLLHLGGRLSAPAPQIAALTPSPVTPAPSLEPPAPKPAAEPLGQSARIEAVAPVPATGIVPPPSTIVPPSSAVVVAPSPEPPAATATLRSAAEAPPPPVETPVPPQPTQYRPPVVAPARPPVAAPARPLVAEPARPPVSEAFNPSTGRIDRDAARIATREAVEAEQRKAQAEAEALARRQAMQDLPVGERISGPPLIYPPRLAREGRGGDVDIDCAVDARGRPSGCRLVEVRGPAPFGNEALAFIRQSSFRPARRGGVNVMEAHHRFHVEFKRDH